MRVTLVAVEPGEDGPLASDAFGADEIRLLTYARPGDSGPPGPPDEPEPGADAPAG